MFSFIWAEAANHVIGQGGTMPWHLKDDLAYFKETTLHHPIIMGRSTFASFGSKPLPKRCNIVLTRDQAFEPGDPSLLVFHDLASVLAYADGKPKTEFFVIGGAQIFAQFLPLAAKLYVTRIHATIAGDTVMPELPMAEFQLISKRVGASDSAHPHDFEIYERIFPA